MKKAILMAMMVAVSTIATAQKIYKSHKVAPDYEYYYVGKDTNSIYIKGSNKAIENIVYSWMKDEKFDIDNPTNHFFDDKINGDVRIWEYVCNDDKDAVLTYYKYKERSMVNIKIFY